MVVQLLKWKGIMGDATVMLKQLWMKSALQTKKDAIIQESAVLAHIIIAIHIRINQSHHKLCLN